jgi:hypothetical protein
MSKKVMYSFRIDEELLNKVRAKAKEKSLPTSIFIKQCLLDKLNEDSRIDDIEKRLAVLEEIVKRK